MRRGSEHHDHDDTQRADPAAMLREVAVIRRAVARAAATPRWLPAAWLAVFVAAMVTVATATLARAAGHHGWPGRLGTLLLCCGAGLFAVWVVAPAVVWQRARRRGVLPRHDPFLPAACGRALSRRQIAVLATLIGLSSAGLGYAIVTIDSHGIRYGGEWALSGSILLGTAAVAFPLGTLRRKEPAR